MDNYFSMLANQFNSYQSKHTYSKWYAHEIDVCLSTIFSDHTLYICPSFAVQLSIEIVKLFVALLIAYPHLYSATCDNNVNILLYILTLFNFKKC